MKDCVVRGHNPFMRFESECRLKAFCRSGFYMLDLSGYVFEKNDADLSGFFPRSNFLKSGILFRTLLECIFLFFD